jgi:hypothetical protein
MVFKELSLCVVGVAGLKTREYKLAVSKIYKEQIIKFKIRLNSKTKKKEMKR